MRFDEMFGGPSHDTPEPARRRYDRKLDNALRWLSREVPRRASVETDMQNSALSSIILPPPAQTVAGSRMRFWLRRIATKDSRSFGMSPTKSSRESAHIPELDGIRGVAIAMVLIFHYFYVPATATPGGLTNHVLAPLRLGWTGVDLCFRRIIKKKKKILINKKKK